MACLPGKFGSLALPRHRRTQHAAFRVHSARCLPLPNRLWHLRHGGPTLRSTFHCSVTAISPLRSTGAARAMLLTLCSNGERAGQNQAATTSWLIWGRYIQRKFRPADLTSFRSKREKTLAAPMLTASSCSLVSSGAFIKIRVESRTFLQALEGFTFVA